MALCVLVGAPRPCRLARPVRRALWGDDPPTSWAKQVQICVGRLRKVLGRRRDRDDRGRVPADARRRRPRRRPVRALVERAVTSPPPANPTGRRPRSARALVAVAGPSVRGPRRVGAGPERGGPARGAAPRRRGGLARRPAGGRGPPRGRGRGRGPRRRGAAARAAVGDPGPGPVPLRPAGRRAPVAGAGPADARRAARHRPGRRTGRARGGDPAPGRRRWHGVAGGRRGRRDVPVQGPGALRRRRRGRRSSAATPRSTACLDRLAATPLLRRRRAVGVRQVVAGARRGGPRPAASWPSVRGRPRAPTPIDALRSPRSRRSTEDAPVLVIDQFEELFALGHARRRSSATFWSGSPPSTRRARPVVIIGLRSDHVGGLGADAEPQPARRAGAAPRQPARPATTLREAIEQPARARPGSASSSGLVELLVRDSEGEPGALPLLSHALAETWRRRDGNVLTVEGYRGHRRDPRRRRPLGRPPLRQPPAGAARRRCGRSCCAWSRPSLDGDPVRFRVRSRSLLGDPGASGWSACSSGPGW